MAVGSERKQQIYVAALQREQGAAALALEGAIEQERQVTATDVVGLSAQADAAIEDIRKARNYLADVAELLGLAQNPGV